MRVLIAETDQQLAEERARQLQMDGHHISLALTSHTTALKLAELPDALVLCGLSTPVQTSALPRALRAGEIPRTDATVPVLVVGADRDADAIRYYQAGADIGSSQETPETGNRLCSSHDKPAVAPRTGTSCSSRLVLEHAAVGAKRSPVL